MTNSNYPGLRAGRLIDFLLLQERIENVDAAGAMEEPSWRTVGKMYADVQPILGRHGGEAIYAEQLQSAVYYRVTVRYRTDITAKHRFVLVGTPDVYLNIKSDPIDPDGRRRRLEITCESGLVDG